jgi:chaperonin GroES
VRIEPLRDVVIIRRLAPETVSAGGIHLVYDPDYKEDIGEVAYVGCGKRIKCNRCKTDTHRPIAVSRGDKVIFSTNGHQITTINGEELVVLREDSIIGVIVE